MQATIDTRNLKPFTRAVTCISKYGDEMIIHAGPDAVVLSALNLAKTAYCSFSYGRHFFLRYGAPRATQSNGTGPSRTNGETTGAAGGPGLRCQLQTKLLLSILKHRNADKTVEKCELLIIDGIDTPEDEMRANEDSFESRLIVRMHCRHGIVKTHRLLLGTPTNDEAPLIPSSDDESRIVVQARAVKEIIEHFPNSKGSKSDPELVWNFNDNDVTVKSMEKSIDAKGKSQLATELKLGADEFDYYNIPNAPLSLGFFLREFNATITLADALNTTIDFRFTTSRQPICINTESDGCGMLFIIATNPARGEDGSQASAARQNQVNGRSNATQRSASGVPAARKRPLEDDGSADGSSRVPPPAVNGTRQNGHTSQRGFSMSQQATVNGETNFNMALDDDGPMLYDDDGGPPPSQPLFLASQLSVAEIETLRETGLGIENMDAEEFAAMLDGDGEEVDQADSRSVPETSTGGIGTDSQLDSEATGSRADSEHDELDEDVDMGPTQLQITKTASSEKTFHPLFED